MPGQITTRGGEHLDAICHHHYGHTAGAVEAVLAANPELAALLPIIPPRITILLPDLPRHQQRTHLLRLWGQIQSTDTASRIAGPSP
ncbi:MAG: phage tail protein [Aphanocapsa feldmannii 277cI]|uniref:Phage tail protein n=1 Tax=Aphanocapsa feldmannii 277cI TaxID=2507554 RepID=A0A524RVX6_9CHRO|nr:MAG: phage tail protein [Aphanocapsa feldmannii 277cI]